MSGGSYNYLCYAEDLESLAQHRDDLQEMHERLAALPWAKAASDETARIIAALDVLDSNYRSRSALRDMWRAIEWWDSGDSGEQTAREAHDAYVAATLQL